MLRSISLSLFLSVARRVQRKVGEVDFSFRFQLIAPSLSLWYSPVCVCVCVGDRFWWVKSVGISFGFRGDFGFEILLF